MRASVVPVVEFSARAPAPLRAPLIAPTETLTEIATVLASIPVLEREVIVTAPEGARTRELSMPAATAVPMLFSARATAMAALIES